MTDRAGLRIRPARPGEAAALSELALRSKAHWGYDAEFLERVRPLLTFQERDLLGAGVRVLASAHGAVGVYRVSGTPPAGELEDLWLEPELIGQGWGRRLLEDALALAAELGFSSLVIEAEPHAEGFYARLGATEVGERRSPSGRTLKLLELRTAQRPGRAGEAAASPPA